MSKKLLCMLGTLLSGCALLAQEGNLVVNPGFEEPMTKKHWVIHGWVKKTPQWKNWFEPTIDDRVSQGMTGSKSLSFQNDTTKTGKTTCQVSMGSGNARTALPKNLKEYTFQAWIKTAMPNRVGREHVGRVQVILNMGGKGKKNIQRGIITPWNAVVPEWTLYRVDGTLPEGYDYFNVSVTFSGYKGSTLTQAWVDNIYFGPRLPKAGETAAKETKSNNAAKLIRGIHRAKHGGIYHPGEKIDYEFHFRSIKKPGTNLDMRWTIRDFDEKKVAEGSKKIKLARRVDFTLPIPKKFLGYYTVNVEFFDNGKFMDKGLFSGMVIPPIEGERDPFFSTRGAGTFEKHVRLGFGKITLHGGGGLTWSIERPDKTYDFEAADRALDSKLKTGFKNIYCNTYFINYHVIPNYKKKEYRKKLKAGINPYTEQDWIDYRNWVRATIKRYGHVIKDWRVPDEIMLTRFDNKFMLTEYSKFCKIFYEEMKKQYPDCKLYAGGALFGDDQFADLKIIVWDKIKNYVDGLCVDAYPQSASVGTGQNYLGPEQLKLRERFKRTFDVTGAKEFVNEEVGSAIQRDFALNHPMLKDYALKNARIITVCRSLPQVKGWTHFLIEDSPSAWNGNFDYAAWKNHQPRPHAFTLAMLTRLTAFATDPIEVKPHNDIYAYIFKQKGKILLILWGMSKDGIDAKINMPANWSGYTLIAKPVSGKAGMANFKLTDVPYYIVLDTTQAKMADAIRKGKYALPEIGLNINRKNGKEVNVYVENKTTADKTVNVVLNNSKAKTITVKPGKIAPVAFADKPISKWDVKATVNKVVYPFRKQEELYFVDRLSTPPAMDGTLKGFEKIKPFVMDTSAWLQPIDAGAWGWWTGAKDLSAKVYLAYDNKFFYAAAEVQDDIHISRASDSMIWNQDCFQFGFDTENDTFDPAKSLGGYNPDDREFCVALTPKGPQNYCYTAPVELRNKFVQGGKVTAVRTKDGRNIYVCAIPWNYFGKLKPVFGSIFGFGCVFFDIDQPKGALPYRIEMSRGIANGKSPADFKRFMLR